MEDILGSKVNLVIGLPTNGRPVAWKCYVSMMAQSWPLNATIMHMGVGGKEIDEARNFIVDKALEVGSKYIWFVDDDVSPPTDTTPKLIYELEQDQNAMVCAGIYCEKREPVCPIVYMEEGNGAFWNWKVGEVFPLKKTGFIGTGCMVIKTEIFQYLDKPYFKTVDEVLDGSDERGTHRRQKTDDAYFCHQVLKQGFKILAHGGVLCGHHDVYTGKEYILPTSSFPYKPVEKSLVTLAGGLS